MNSRSVVAQHPEKWALRVDHHRCLKAVSGAGRRDVEVARAGLARAVQIHNLSRHRGRSPTHESRGILRRELRAQRGPQFARPERLQVIAS
jgi:hypothetical protein